MQQTIASFSAQAVAVMLQRDLSSLENQTAPEHQERLAYQFKPYALVVDDSVDIAYLLVMFLQHVGYDARMAISPTEAFAVARRKHFDLVISDIGMPGMDGYTLARALRALPGYGDVSMIAVTGIAEYDDRARALSSGFNAYMRKPIDLVSLGGLIESLRC